MARNETVKYLFVGGGLANGTAAQTAREKDPEGRILIVTNEKHPPYHRPPMSKEYLRGEAGWEDARLAPEQDWVAKNIEIRTGVTATGLDTAAKVVTLDTGDTIQYEKLCIGTGARPNPLPLPGADAPNVFLLRTRDDSDAIRAAMTPGAKAVLIGAGYIGMEVAAGCRQKEVEATVIEPAPYPWKRFASEAFGRFLRRYYEERGVRFLLEDAPAEIVTGGDGRATAVRTKNGEEVPADFVLIGVGVTLNTELARQAGLKVDPKEGIEINEYLETGVPDVYAAGDVAKFRDPVFDRSWHIEHWQNAEWHGQIAGANMASGGERVAYDHVPWFFSDEFDIHMTLRGDSSDGKTSFFQGNPDTDKRFLELYLREDGTLAMGILISPEFDESETADLLEKLIRARVNLRPHQEEIAAGRKDLASLLPDQR